MPDLQHSSPQEHNPLQGGLRKECWSRSVIAELRTPELWVVSTPVKTDDKICITKHCSGQAFMTMFSVQVIIAHRKINQSSFKKKRCCVLCMVLTHHYHRHPHDLITRAEANPPHNEEAAYQHPHEEACKEVLPYSHMTASLACRLNTISWETLSQVTELNSICTPDAQKLWEIMTCYFILPNLRVTVYIEMGN